MKTIDSGFRVMAKEIERMLAAGVQYFPDGGSSIHVVAEQCAGPQQVAQHITHVYYASNHHLTKLFTEINYQPIVAYFKYDQLISCRIFEMEGDIAVRIDTIPDPEKLRAISDIFQQT